MLTRSIVWVCVDDNTKLLLSFVVEGFEFHGTQGRDQALLRFRLQIKVDGHGANVMVIGKEFSIVTLDGINVIGRQPFISVQRPFFGCLGSA